MDLFHGYFVLARILSIRRLLGFLLFISMEVSMEMLLFLFLVSGRLPRRQVTSDSSKREL
jgi:hypothetical protein